MSDILIKNMEMPKNCGCCPLEVGGRFTFTCMRMIGKEFSYELAEQRQEDCPLIEVPPHGRLGDLDIMKEAFEQTALIEASIDKGNEQIYLDRVKLVHGIIDRTPTVLGASKEEE